MSRQPPRIRLSEPSPEGERLWMRETLRLVLHLPLDHHDLADRVLQSLEVYLRGIRAVPGALSEGHDLESDPFPLDGSGWELVRSLLSPPSGERFLEDFKDAELRRYVKRGFQRSMVLSSGDTELSGHGFFYWARLPWRIRARSPDSVSLVSFSWPTEFLEEHGPEQMRELLLALASLLPFSSGHAGLAFSSPDPFCASLRGISAEAFRHPGLDVAHGNTSLGAQVDGVHWLNFLGPPVLEEAGGAAGLSARLHAPETTLQPLGEARAVVTLGPWPEAGDLARGEGLPAYRELARVLEPWLSACPDAYAFDGASHEETLRWWRRFLE